MSTQSLVGSGPDRDTPHKLFSEGLRLGEFAREALAEESARLGVSSEELASFSVMYYLADFDSGRIARRRPPLTPSTHPSEREASWARGELARSQARSFARRAVRCS
jgi:hypothetical protein